MSKVLIYDDIISKEYQDFLEDIFVNQAGMYWGIVPDLNSPLTIANLNGIDCFVNKVPDNRKTYGLVRQPITRGQESDPVLSVLLKSFIYAVTDRIDAKVSRVNTARAFLQLPWASPIQNKFHIDDIEPHIVLLYYVNDSDGDTLITDKQFTGEEPDYNIDANIIERVSPKKGRAILFDGHTYHAASVPKNNLRCVLNFNLT